MWGKHRLVASWAVAACLVLAAFYAAVAWLWSAAEESRVASLEREVVSALAGDLAEGNLLKLGATLSKLQQDGHLRFAEIRRLPDAKGRGLVFRTPGPDERTDAVFAAFRCGEQRKIVGHPQRGISLITTLPGSTAGADCAALYIGSDFPGELIRFKNRLTASFGVLVACMFGFFFWFITSWYQRILKLEVEKESAISRIAAQVAHDIRSPLAALDSVTKDLSQLPEDKRVIIRGAVGRIRDIANHLIEKYRQSPQAAGGGDGPKSALSAVEPASDQLLSSLIEPVITEKRLQFRSKIGVEIDAGLGAPSYGLFARIEVSEFKRVLSNLINNGVEALDRTGAVTVHLASAGDQILLEVSDDGKGIPPEVAARLGRKGETHGKPGGSGLGLYHAKTCVEAWGGSLAIKSEPGQGTTVALRLPVARPPAWFVSRLELRPDSVVVVLDDDPSIHQVWQGRFGSSRTKGSGIEILHFSTPAELREWVRGNAAASGNALFLMDYELLGHGETGLSLVEELGLGGKAILVTSRFEEDAILKDCRRLGVRMIPKGMAGFVPIDVRSRAAAPAAVLLDDDALVRMTWSVAAQSKGLRLASYENPEEFLAAVEQLPKDTPVYLDSDLGDGPRGEEIAKGLHAKGFVNLYLATGHAPGSLPAMPWIKQVVGKDPPWD